MTIRNFGQRLSQAFQAFAHQWTRFTPSPHSKWESPLFPPVDAQPLMPASSDSDPVLGPASFQADSRKVILGGNLLFIPPGGSHSLRPMDQIMEVQIRRADGRLCQWVLYDRRTGGYMDMLHPSAPHPHSPTPDR